MLLLTKYIDNEETSESITNEILEAMRESKITSRAKIRDRIKIVDNTSSHFFEIGSIVRVIDWQPEFEPDDEYGVQATDDDQHWFVYHSDYEIVE